LHNKALNKQITGIEEISEGLIEVFSTFRAEFRDIIPFGRTYRKKCFNEISIIILKSLTNLQGKKVGLGLLDDYLPFVERMNKQDAVINSSSGFFGRLYAKGNRTREESEIMFNTACITYQVVLEGIFSELIRILYAKMKVASDKKVPSSEVLSSSNIWKIYRKCEEEFAIKPIFLENLPKKINIRNAIAHAQTNYNSSIDQAHFISKENGIIIYDKLMTFSEFYEIWMQIADAIDSYRYIMRFLDAIDNLCKLYLSQSNPYSN
jgi:hypothetical protein